MTCRRGAVVALLAGAVPGCGTDRPPPDERPDAQWYDADTPVWTVSDSAAVFRSATVGTGQQQIHLFRVITARFDEAGGILAAVGGDQQRIVALDSLGRMLWSAGGAGDGPGEFRFIQNAVTARNNTAFVWDMSHRRVSIFDGATFQKDAPLEAEASRNLVGIVGDSLVVLAPTVLGSLPGTVRSYDVWSLAGDRVATLDGFVEPQSNLATVSVEHDNGAYTSRTDLPACIAGMLDAVGEGHLYVVNAADALGSVQVLDTSNGSRRQLYRTAAQPTVTESLIQDVRRRFQWIEKSAQTPGPAPPGAATPTNPRLVQDSVAAILGQIGAPGSPLPSTWTELVLDESAGHLWLHRANCNDDGAEQEWEVIDTAGRLVARVRLPASVRVRDVSYPNVLVTMTDSLDVEYLGVVPVAPGR